MLRAGARSLRPRRFARELQGSGRWRVRPWSGVGVCVCADGDELVAFGDLCLKQLARLLKVWKCERSVPVSSCYLEMRAAKHMDEQSAYIPVWDVYMVLDDLETYSLAAMNDPTGLGARFTACSSDATKRDAMSKLSTAVGRARRAKDYYSDGDHAGSVAQLKLLFDR